MENYRPPNPQPKETEVAMSAWEKIKKPIGDTLLGEYRQRAWLVKGSLIGLAAWAGIEFTENMVQDGVGAIEEFAKNAPQSIKDTMAFGYDKITEEMIFDSEAWGFDNPEIRQTFEDIFISNVSQEGFINSIEDPNIKEVLGKVNLENLQTSPDALNDLLTQLAKINREVTPGPHQTGVVTEGEIEGIKDEIQDTILTGFGLPTIAEAADTTEEIFTGLSDLNAEKISFPDNINYGVPVGLGIAGAATSFLLDTRRHKGGRALPKDASFYIPPPLATKSSKSPFPKET